MHSLVGLALGALSILVGSQYAGLGRWPRIKPWQTTEIEDHVERWSCRPFLPNLFAETPPTTHPALTNASEALNIYLSTRFLQGDIDSLSVAVVSSTSALFENNLGVMRANETTSSPTHSHSVYRIASVAKLLNVLEGFILEQKGLISWYVCALTCDDDHASRHAVGTMLSTNTSSTSITWQMASTRVGSS